MEIRWHNSVTAFLELTQSELEKNEALNNLMLGICFRAEADPDYYPDIKLATIFGQTGSDQTGLILAAVMTPPHNIILHSNGEMVEQAMECLANSLQSEGIFIPGVIGVKNVADRFSRIWAKRAACGVELHAALRAYVLKSVNHDLIGPGVFRPAEEGDLDFLTAGWVQFHIECGLQNELVPENVVSNVQARIANGSLFVWEDGGQVVSMAAKTRSMRHGAVIGYVYTPHELRGRGYATSCVASMSQHLLDSGHEYCALFTDLANPISNSIYQKIGYRPVGDYNNLRFDYE